MRKVERSSKMEGLKGIVGCPKQENVSPVKESIRRFRVGESSSLVGFIGFFFLVGYSLS